MWPSSFASENEGLTDCQLDSIVKCTEHEPKSVLFLSDWDGGHLVDSGLLVEGVLLCSAGYVHLINMI